MRAAKVVCSIAAWVLLLAASAANVSGARRTWLLQDEEDLFLRGCRGDRKCAVAKHAKLLDFRREHPDVYRNLTSGDINGMIRMGAVLLNGVTCSGHVVFLCGIGSSIGTGACSSFCRLLSSQSFKAAATVPVPPSARHYVQM